MENEFCRKFSIRYPLIVAPMAGGPSSVDLVVASSEAGAMGSVGAAYMSASQIQDFVSKVRQRTECPFSVNLFVPQKFTEPNDEQKNKAIQTTKIFRQELGLEDPVIQGPYEENFDQQFEMVLKLRPKILSFVFGTLSREYFKEVQKNGILTIGAATTAEEALISEESGVDAVVLQGIEAGGHRAMFSYLVDDPKISTWDLLQALKSKLKIPMIAAGGIMNKSDVHRMIAGGAAAVQMGTAFLTTQESGTSLVYKNELLRSEIRLTRTTRAFSGRLARGIENKFMKEMENQTSSILPFPVQNKFTRDLRNASLEKKSSDYLSLWSGSGEGKLWTGSAGELIKSIFSHD